MYLNRLTLIGFIGRDAETKTISNGSTFTALSVATQRSLKNSEGASESHTEWHRCVSFGKLADFAATLKKGAHEQVEGELRGREYEKDGVKHKVFECRLESILKLDRAERRGENESDGSRELISKEGCSPPRASAPPFPASKLHQCNAARYGGLIALGGGLLRALNVHLT